MIASKWQFPLNLNRKKPGLHPADNFPGVFRIKNNENTQTTPGRCAGSLLMNLVKTYHRRLQFQIC